MCICDTVSYSLCCNERFRLWCSNVVQCRVYFTFLSQLICCRFQNGTACSCLDCEASCPVPPPKPPAPAPFVVAGLDGYALIMLLVFILGSLLFLGGVFCCTPSANNTVGMWIFFQLYFYCTTFNLEYIKHTCVINIFCF